MLSRHVLLPSVCVFRVWQVARAIGLTLLVAFIAGVQEFLAFYNSTVEAELACARLAPSCQLYATTILSTVHERAFYEGAPAAP